MINANLITSLLHKMPSSFTVHDVTKGTKVFHLVLYMAEASSV